MMAAMTMDREPEVARFIDTYKFDQQMSEKREKYGGGTSLPLHSDGYEDKQKQLRDERHREWMLQQEKIVPHVPDPFHQLHAPVSKGPQQPGDYEEEIRRMTDRYHNKYREVLHSADSQQRQLEKQRLEARRRSPPRPSQAPPPQMDYQQSQEQARAEERRAYQDYMKSKEERYWAMRGRPVTPPGGLDIGQYDRQVKEQASQKKKEYKDMLDQQQREHMFLRARQEPEVPVLDRSVNQNLASKPPPGPSYRAQSEQPSRQTPAYWNEGQRARSPLSLDSEPSRPIQRVDNSDVPLSLEDQRKREEMHHNAAASKPADVVKNPYYNSDNYESYQKDLHRKQKEEYQEFLSKQYQPPAGSVGLPLGQYVYEPKRLAMEAERNKEYNDMLKKSRRNPSHQIDGPQGLNIDVNFHERKKAWLERQRNDDYNKYLRKRSLRDKIPTPPSLQGLPIGQHNYEPMHRAMEHQRNREYNEFLRKKYSHDKHKAASEPDRASFYYGNETEHEERRRQLDQERHREYNDMIQKQRMKDPPRRHDYLDSAPGPYNGLFHGLGEHGNSKEVLSSQRRQEYNDRMEKQYEGKERPSGRPSWARDTLPNYSDRGRSPGMRNPQGPDHYQQMLDEKRREEAQRRRFDDPEYQGRLAQSSRDQQRYNY